MLSAGSIIRTVNITGMVLPPLLNLPPAVLAGTRREIPNTYRRLPATDMAKYTAFTLAVEPSDTELCVGSLRCNRDDSCSRCTRDAECSDSRQKRPQRTISTLGFQTSRQF